MAAKQLMIEELSEVGKKMAVSDFVDFYLPRFKTGSLEIVSSFGGDYYMMGINHFVQENSSMRPEELKASLINEYAGQIRNLIATLDQTFNANGSVTSKNWEAWNQAHYDQVLMESN